MFITLEGIDGGGKTMSDWDFSTYTDEELSNLLEYAGGGSDFYVVISGVSQEQKKRAKQKRAEEEDKP